MNPMSELTTNRLWDIGTKDRPSQYARMILGTPEMPPPRFPPTAGATPKPAAGAIDQTTTRQAQARTLTQLLLPQTAVDRFTLGELLAADLMVLVAVCGALSLFLPAWGLPWAYLPIFAALVTLFGFSEGVYKRAGDPSPVGLVPALAKSTLFAIGLVFIAAGRNASCRRPGDIFQQPRRPRAVPLVETVCMETATPPNRIAQDPHHWRGADRSLHRPGTAQ